MEVGLWLLALCALLLPALWLLSFLRTDTDLTLLWAAWLGRRPEQVLTGMVVWVTGASSGIGEELAFQLSKLGVSLVLSARRTQELERVKRRCLENGNMKERDILVLPLDLADTSSHDTATKAVLQEFGRIDILVNNSGIAHYSFAVDTNLDVFKLITDVNYLGTVSLTKCVLPHMMERNRGKIVIINSIAGIIPVPLCSAYSGSKHALRVLGKQARDIPKMSTSRCVWLILVSMANDLKEVWIADQPVLFAIYLGQYMPFLDWIISKKTWGKIINQYIMDWHNYLENSCHKRPSK
ncbi:dehydrogenase/reductase SDR family member 7-like isoform X4 [Psammomys obesus]|uniref:dehydrogenase/reductase SDR family member 7-like isoform X4 n=1 Tax=Psammomys obesus TaxID=48139 RepID=UPI002453640D|nr:dehydrogenase/reductase SDR family member 7-like isoform X4 [Psammomys obesus]